MIMPVLLQMIFTSHLHQTSGVRQHVKRMDYRLHKEEHIFLAYAESSVHMARVKH